MRVVVQMFNSRDTPPEVIPLVMKLTLSLSHYKRYDGQNDCLELFEVSTSETVEVHVGPAYSFPFLFVLLLFIFSMDRLEYDMPRVCV